jgi:hypothetical protein
MTLPNFLIIGAAKAGTTALHTYLQQHPQIYMTPDKETNFFAFEGEIPNFQGPGDEALKNFSITNLAEYEKLFSGVTDEIAIGEACPLYLYHRHAPQKIYHYIPDVRLIVILRDPVERAYANYLHLVRDGREPDKDFGYALQDEERRIQNNWEWFWHYQQLGYYTEQIKRYYRVFSKEQIAIYLYEDLKADSKNLLENIFRFLEVDDQFVPDLTIRPNKSGMPKNKLLHQLLMKPNPLKTILKPLFPSFLRQKIQHKNLTTPQLSVQIRQQLIELYREDILRCQEIIDRDLSGWLVGSNS